MTTDAIYKECGSDWSLQVSAVGTTWWFMTRPFLSLRRVWLARLTKTTFGSWYLHNKPQELCNILHTELGSSTSRSLWIVHATSVEVHYKQLYLSSLFQSSGRNSIWLIQLHVGSSANYFRVNCIVLSTLTVEGERIAVYVVWQRLLCWSSAWTSWLG